MKARAIIPTKGSGDAFRVFDIFKPPPARAMEKLPLGWGVLVDDLVAGLYANIAAQVFLRVVLHW